MSYIVLVLVLLAGALGGWLIHHVQVRPHLDKLRRLTDRDERGRFVRREP